MPIIIATCATVILSMFVGIHQDNVTVKAQKKPEPTQLNEYMKYEKTCLNDWKLSANMCEQAWYDYIAYKR